MDEDDPIAKLRRDALHTVEIGGYEWQIRRVDAGTVDARKQADLRILSRAALLAQQAQAEQIGALSRMPAPKTAAEIAEAELLLAAVMDGQIRQAQLRSPAQNAELQEADRVLLCAAVVAFRPVGRESWTPVRLVAEDEPAPLGDDGRGQIPIRDLPEGAESVLVGEAAAWATGGPKGVAALRRFRDGFASDKADPAPAGEGVQPAPLRAVAGG